MTAQTNLGYAYHIGQGVVQTDAEAIKWTGKAADQGDAQAQNDYWLSPAAREDTISSGERVSAK